MSLQNITPSQSRTFQRLMDAIGQADREQALSLATEACKGGDDQPLVLMLAAEKLEEAGELEQAHKLLQRAIDNEANEPELWRRYGQLLVRLGRHTEALRAFEEALDIDPDNSVILQAAGQLCYRSGLLHPARKHYDDANRLQPDNPEILATLASIHAQLEDATQARELGSRALELSPGNLVAQIAIARADLLEGKAQDALARVTSMLSGEVDARLALALLDICADAQDALDRPTEAFAAYSARNAMLEKLVAPLVTREVKERRVAQARRMTEFFRSSAAGSWPTDHSTDTGAHPPHAFILGFPRSGTTLLEKSLAGHPDVVTLPEIDLLTKAGAELLKSDEGLRRLAKLDSAELERYRNAYWGSVAEITKTPPGDRLIVDKLPLHTLALPLISRLFPNARIIFAVRDPRDVVLSCFRRRFQLNSAMYEFLTLPRATEFYGAVMDLATTFLPLSPLAVRTVRHEELASDYEAKLGDTLQFLGLDWDEGVRGFNRLARENPRTPTDLQLIKGLTTQGIGQWTRYREQLEPVLPLLDRWVRHFNYGDESPQ